MPQVKQPPLQSQQHPVSLYLTVWVLLFILGAGSYSVDYFGWQGMLRRRLVATFMLLEAGAIVAVFMHMRWERLALMYAILVPPSCLRVLVSLMAIEGRYTFNTRGAYCATAAVPPTATEQHGK